MITTRQQLIQSAVTHLSITNRAPKADSTIMNDVVEEMAHKNPITWAYYTSMTDKQYFKMAREIERQSKKRHSTRS